MVAVTVCTEVVSRGYCVGCGTCAGTCASLHGDSALRMQWSRAGVPEPVVDLSTCRDCGMCVSVCPMHDRNDDVGVMGDELFPNGTTPEPVLGRYLDLYGGYSTVRGHRENGAGGGITTWFLEKLLTNGAVERVICVAPGDSPDSLFSFAVLETPEDVRRASRSAYYPVEISDVLATVNELDGRYAIVGLPCVIKGVRLASRNIPGLAKKLAMTVGLTCGQGRTRYFAEYLCAKCGVAPSAVEQVRFRVKDSSRHHLDHRFECYTAESDAEPAGSIYQTDGMGWLWGHDCFKNDACNYCDDITAETADISFADAVDEPYCHGNNGANFVIVRSESAKAVLEAGMTDGELVLEDVPAEAVRQRMEGVELIKRHDLAHRLYQLQEAGDTVPALRQKPEQRHDAKANEWMALRDALREACRDTYAAHRHQEDVVAQVEQAIKTILDKEGS